MQINKRNNTAVWKELNWTTYSWLFICYMCSSSISYMVTAACCWCIGRSKSRYLLCSSGADLFRQDQIHQHCHVHYHTNPSESCHDRNIYGRIDLLHCCCGRASTETCYSQYIHNMLLWACKKYYIYTCVCRSTQHSLILFSGASEVNAGLSGGIRAWLKRGVLVFLMYIHITEAPWAITARLHKP